MNRRDEELVSRIYVGNLPSQIDHRELEREFERFGKVIKCDLKKTVSGAPFAFIEFEDPRDARDAIKERDGYDFDGSRLRVEIPFNARSGGDRRGGRGGDRGDRSGGGGGLGRGGRREPPRKGRYVLQISGLPLSGSWQDIKDHMRDAGECGHADVFHDGTGEISFFNRQDAESAISRYNGSLFRSHEGDKSYITVQEKDFAFGRDSDRQGLRYRSPSYERRRDRYNDNKRDSSPYNRESEKYNRRYSTSRSNSRSHSYSRSDSYNYNSQKNNYNYRRYNAGGRSRSRSRGTSESRSRSYNRR